MQPSASVDASTTEPLSWFSVAIIALFTLYMIGGLVARHYMHMRDQRRGRMTMPSLLSMALAANALGFVLWLLLWPALLVFHPDDEAEDEPPSYHGPTA